MSEGRSFLGSAAVDGRVFLIGGCLNEDYSTTEVWDPHTGTFQYIAKEPTSHIIPSHLCSPLSLVEEYRGLTLIGREDHSVATPALLCHKEPARRIQSPLLGAPRWFFMA